MNKQITMEIMSNDIDLDEPCWACNELEKPALGVDESEKCSLCHGIGSLLTNNGQAIIDLMTRYQTEGS